MGLIRIPILFMVNLPIFVLIIYINKEHIYTYIYVCISQNIQKVKVYEYLYKRRYYYY